MKELGLCTPSKNEDPVHLGKINHVNLVVSECFLVFVEPSPLILRMQVVQLRLENLYNSRPSREEDWNQHGKVPMKFTMHFCKQKNMNKTLRLCHNLLHDFIFDLTNPPKVCFCFEDLQVIAQLETDVQAKAAHIKKWWPRCWTVTFV